MHQFAAQPRKATSTKVGTAEDDRLPGRPTDKFVYAHHPNNWEWIDGAYLPRLTKVPLRPGVNGCKKGRGGHIPVLNRLRSEGWTVIDESGPVKLTGEDGEIVDDTGYLLAWPGRIGPIHQDCWSIPSLLGAGNSATVDWSSQFDREGWNAWRLWLLAEKLIAPPTAGVLNHLLKLQNRRASRRSGESHDGNPHIQAHVRREQDKLTAMSDAAIDSGAKVKNAKRKPRGRPRKVTK